MQKSEFVERVSTGFHHPREWTKAEVAKKARDYFARDFPKWQSSEFHAEIESVDQKGLGFSDFVFVVTKVG